jgi:hypothetical protein
MAPQHQVSRLVCFYLKQADGTRKTLFGTGGSGEDHGDGRFYYISASPADREAFARLIREWIDALKAAIRQDWRPEAVKKMPKGNDFSPAIAQQDQRQATTG